jgi:hypothetical protein
LRVVALARERREQVRKDNVADVRDFLLRSPRAPRP